MRQQVGQDGGLKKVTVEVSALKDKVEKNRGQHVKDYELAMKGWQKEIKKALLKDIKGLEKSIADKKARLARIEAGKEIGTAHPAVEYIESHVADYDRTVMMLEMTVDTKIEIEEYAFNQLVMDEWEWSQAWKLTSSNYAMSAESP